MWKIRFRTHETLQIGLKTFYPSSTRFDELKDFGEKVFWSPFTSPGSFFYIVNIKENAEISKENSLKYKIKDRDLIK